MPCDSFVISHWDRTHGEYDAVYLVEGDKRFPSQPIPEGQGLTGQVVSGGETIIIDDTDVADQGKFRRFGSPQRVRSLIATPLRAGDQITGMISAQSFQTNAFGEEERALIEMLAAYAATAIENSRLFEEIRRRLLELEGVNRVSTALRSAQTSAEMFPILLNETLSVLDTEAGCIWLYDPTSDELSMKVAHGWVKDLNNKHIKPSDGIVGHTFRTGEAHLSPDFLTDPYLHKDNQSTVPAGWGGASIPIRTSTETIGVFFIGVEAPRQLGQDEINLLTTLSEMAGNAIHRAELHERTERQVRRLTALRDVDIAIASSFDLRVTLNILIDQAISQLNVNAADILLYNPTLQNLSYIAGQGFISSGILQSQQRIGEGLAGKAILERSLIQVPDLNAEPHFARQSLLQKEEFVSYFAVPLVGKGQIKGVFEVFHRSSLSPSAGWLNFLQTLASQAAIAIDNAQLFENLQRTNQELSLAYDTTLEGWGRALELRDKETEGHTRRVTEMTVQLARRMGIGDEELTHVRRGVLLHDIGKMGVPDQILRKTGPLTEDEWDSMQNHPQYAYDLLYPIAYLRPALDIPYCHHERWDGRGYPRGLSGDEIPVAARIFSIIDVWDALLSDRPYRKAWSREKTLAYIKEQSGKRFDPAVVKEFLKMLAEEE
jgi:HD-GYP domain-containing protein (c-di-GMP phosphodiesterase class II)